jgi:hypothetical protein
MAQTTRTLNPLPFGDLEPHRFEDLVRQLAYEFRNWKSIEATGRSGSDEGIDIRAFERVGPDIEESEQGDDAGDEPQDESTAAQDRLWVIQCKREKRISPVNVRTILNDFFKGDTRPYGYILAAACDFSKKARDTAASFLRDHGVQEFLLWGKGELEDLLIQPKNDNLLFAYFGISLQVRRRSMRTEVRSKLTLKRKLVKEFGDLQGTHFKHVLIRDPRDEDYPYIRSAEAFIKAPKWRYWQFHSHEPPDHVAFVTRKFFAYANWETEEWDFAKESNEAIPSHPELFGLDGDAFDPEHLSQICRAYWERHVPALNQAWAIEIGIISYDRILLCDELGDHYHESPHLLVEYLDGQPFEGFMQWIEPNDRYSGQRLWTPDESKRITFFPKPIPDEREQWYEEIRTKSEERSRTNRT